MKCKFLLFILISSLIFSSEVSKSRADDVALKWYEHLSNATKSIDTTLCHISNGDTLLFVYSFDDNGFTIVPGNDALPPILAYSKEPSDITDTTNIAFNDWIQRYSVMVDSANVRQSSNSSTIDRWDDIEDEDFLMHSTSRDVDALLTTVWQQEPYYNYECPYDEEEEQYTVVGCVAVAMGQIMKYHSHPEHGFGENEYESDYGLLSVDFSEAEYDYSNMPNSLTSENIELATFLYHLGVSVNMDYGIESEGSWSDTGPNNPLKDYFFYSENMKSYSLSQNTEDWHDLLQNDLDNSLPIYYSGGGHAFVVDGYNSENLTYHINWGLWEGLLDGDFWIDDLTPGLWDFNEFDRITANIYPGLSVELKNVYSAGGIGGELEYNDLDNPGEGYITVDSGDDIALEFDHSYQFRATPGPISTATYDRYFLHWVDDESEYGLEWSLDEEDINIDFPYFGDGITAFHKRKHELEITMPISPFVDVTILDPWYFTWNSIIEEWEQPESFFPIVDVSEFDDYNQIYLYNVFVGINPDFDPTLPIYELCAGKYYATLNNIFEFNEWQGNNDVNFSTVGNLCKEVHFEPWYPRITVDYDEVSYTSVLTISEDLTIPAGAEYEFEDDFRIDVTNGATLTFAGTAEDPIVLKPADNSGWDGIRVQGSSNIKLMYTNIIDADIGLDIQSSASELWDISNCSFVFCDKAIVIQHDDFEDLEIKNNIFHQNDVAIDLEFYDGSSTGVGSELTIKNNIFYDGTTTYIEEYDCTTNCYDSSDLIYDNPDLVDADLAEQNFDLNLMWVSPCINAGASGMTADTDNTVKDLGANYFHITLGDLNADGDWDVSDITPMTDYIIDPDPATLTSTMLDIGDLTDDEDIDVLDVVALVDCIQGDDCDELDRSTPPAGSANLMAYQPESLDRSEADAIVISIESDVPVYGLQFDIEFESSEYELYNVELTDVTEGFELEYRDYGNGTVRVLSYSLEAESIPTGINEVLVMNLDGLERGESNIAYTVVNAKVSDEHGNNLLLSGSNPANTELPSTFALHPAHPNPFNPVTRISYELPVGSIVDLVVYDMMGRKVVELVSGQVAAGYHSVKWDATGYASGIYFVKLVTPGYKETQKVVLLK
ncbi:MAG: C10 family peptidase [Candidatus Marinimicrobia bacterium]|nr:C10 family peptidase [Candidatus Neomarinimicrobiota bacterium]